MRRLTHLAVGNNGDMGKILIGIIVIVVIVAVVWWYLSRRRV
jgi:uncharacterized membrane protein YwzB